MSELQSMDQRYVAGTYKRFPVEIIGGRGSTVWDTDGKKYIDMGSGIGVTAFGISDDVWQKAVCDQLSKVQHMSNLYYTQPCAKLAELLCQRTGFQKIFFCNSGAEANECAIKVARKYASEKKGSDFFTIVTLENSFHGRTLTTLSATGQAHYHELFQPLTPGFVHAPANRLKDCIDIIERNHAAAVMIECIQGEGGVLTLDPDFVKGLAEYSSQNDIVLIVDEVQTGNGRTGALYAYMHYGIRPDIVTTAKGLGGGLPIGATLLGDKVQNILGYGDHGSTFGGNPVCCAGAISILNRLDEPFLAEVRTKSAYLFETLQHTSGVEYVTGKGLMIGIKTEKPASDVVENCLKNGVLCLTAKEKVRLLPALNISWDELKQAVSVIQKACAL